MNRSFLTVVLFATLAVATLPTLGQQPAPPTPAVQAPRTVDSRPAAAWRQRQPSSQPPRQQQPPTDQPTEPYMLRPGVYVIPAPYSPDYWSPTIRSYSSLGDPRSLFGSRVRTYRGQDSGNWGYWNPYPPPYASGPGDYTDYSYPPYGGDLSTAYMQGRYDAEHDYVWYIASQRAGRLINQWAEQFDDAIIQFHDGNYERAAIDMLGAAEKNHADGASRLHAGHALFAIGRYTEAVHLIERAFELAPSLAYKNYDIREEYGDQSEFDQHLAALQTYVVGHPNDAAAVTLLGYVTYYTSGPSTAYPYLKKAAQLNPRSYFIPKLLTPAQMVSKPDRQPAAPTKPQPQPQLQKSKQGKAAPQTPQSKPLKTLGGRAIAIAN